MNEYKYRICRVCDLEWNVSAKAENVKKYICPVCRNIAFVIRSDYKTCVWLKDRYANAEVVFFHCVRKDVLAVVIDTSREGI